MIDINEKLTPAKLLSKLERFWEVSAVAIDAVERRCPPGSPSPVFTIGGRYASKGWTVLSALP